MLSHYLIIYNWLNSWYIPLDQMQHSKDGHQIFKLDLIIWLCQNQRNPESYKHHTNSVIQISSSKQIFLFNTHTSKKIHVEVHSNIINVSYIQQEQQKSFLSFLEKSIWSNHNNIPRILEKIILSFKFSMAFTIISISIHMFL